MDTCKLSFSAAATGPGLHLRAWVNDQVIADQALAESEIVNVEHEFEDVEDVEHTLTIEMSGKSLEHTKVDDVGEIVSDRVINISNLMLDEISLGQVLYELADYTHDFNGTQPEITEKFYGTMGCNGVVQFKFASPVYLWLLENM